MYRCWALTLSSLYHDWPTRPIFMLWKRREFVLLVEKHAVYLFRCNWQCHELILLCSLSSFNFLFVSIECSFLISQSIANFHLLFDQIFSLREWTNELLTFFPLESPHFVLVDNISYFKFLLISFTLLQLVNEFLSQDTFFIVKV